MLTLNALYKCFCDLKSQVADFTSQILNLPESPILDAIYVESDGTISESLNNLVSVTRISTGLYLVTHNNNKLKTIAQATIEEAYATRDSITVRIDPTSRTLNSFRLHTTEGDNGTNANTPRDRAFNLTIYK